MRCSKNLIDAREKNIQQRAKSLSLAGALKFKVWEEERRGLGGVCDINVISTSISIFEVN